jgi:DNA-directed RNA polymerase specialized sigma24 family protein
VPEIAEALGEPLTTVEGRVYRALRKLRTELD